MNILAFCALNPSRRFPIAEAQILQIENVSRVVFDASDDAALPWHENVFRKYQRAREMVLREGFDALLTAESDMLIPRDAAKRLAALDVPVAYGLYVLRHGVRVWNAFVALQEDAGFSLSDPLVRGNAPDEWRAANALEPFQSYGAGFGCTLIRREVLEKLDFRNFQESFFVDWLFAADCNARGIKQMTDPRVACGHIAESGIVLYPDMTQYDLCRAEYLPA